MSKKKKYFISGLAVLSVLAITAGASSVMAADTSANSLIDKFKIRHGQERQELTDDQKAEIKTKIEAVKSALEAGDYNAWVAAQKAINEDCPMLDKITSDNFSKYVEANNLRKQADNIMKDLGINDMGRGDMDGLGLGNGGFGGHRGAGRGQNVDTQE